mgnify:FL=1|jgi:uncharacterized protein
MLQSVYFASILLASTAVSHVSAADTRVSDAAEHTDWPQLLLLIQNDADPNKAQPDGMTALHWAAFHGKSEIVLQLIEAKANVNAKTRYAVTPLSIACSVDQPKTVQHLLSAGADANQTLPGGETPLMTAARSGNAEAVRLLLKHEAKIDAAERKGQTALMWAAAEGHVEVVAALIETGAELNATSKSDFTAMMFAARDGRSAVIEKLLQAGVDINGLMSPEGDGKRVPRKGTSALTMAVESGHFELAMYLVSQGADPNDQRSGVTPLHAVAGIRKPNRGEDPDGDPPPRGSGNMTSLQFVRAIVAAGADVNTKLSQGNGGKAVLNRKGATPLLLAAKTADVELMSLLVELGANPQLTNVDGCTPLMAAAGIGVRAVGEEAGTEPEVIDALKFLIGHGLDVNASDTNKETAMHGAAYRCFPQVITFLSQQGADPAAWNHRNKYGWTPVMIGQGHRPGSFKPHQETVDALEAAMR